MRKLQAVDSFKNDCRLFSCVNLARSKIRDSTVKIKSGGHLFAVQSAFWDKFDKKKVVFFCF